MRKIVSVLVMALSFMAAEAATAIKISDYASAYSNGEYMFALTSEDGHWLVMYYVQAETIESGKTYGKTQLSGSYANYAKNAFATATEHSFTDASFQMVSDPEKKTCVIDAMFVSGVDSETYTLSYSGSLFEDNTPVIPPTEEVVLTMADDEIEEDIALTLASEDAIPYTQPMITDKEITIECTGTSDEKVTIVFNAELSRFDGVCYAPEGVYSIGEGSELGSVQSGKGHNAGKTLYVGTYVKKGDKVWYVTSGEVEVKRSYGELYLHLTGENTKGKKVEVTIGEEPETGETMVINKVDMTPFGGKMEVMLRGADNEHFFFFTILADELISGKTYSLNDMEASGSYAKYLNSKAPWNNTAYKAASFQWSRDKGLEHVVADVLVDGRGAFHLVYDQQELPVATDTVRQDIADGLFMEYATQGYFVLSGKAEGYALCAVCNIAMNSRVYEGEYKGLGDYNEAGKLSDYSTRLWTVKGDDSVAISLVYAEAKVVECTDQDGLYYTAEIYLQDDMQHGYFFTITGKTLHGSKTELFKAVDLVMTDHRDAYPSQIVFNATCDDKQISLWIITKGTSGHYTGTMISSCTIGSTDISDAWTINILYGDVTVEAKGEDVKVTGRVVMEDYTEYELEMKSLDEGVENVNADSKGKKILIDGQVMIEKGGKLYDVLGR